jgi:hypothetical protein
LNDYIGLVALASEADLAVALTTLSAENRCKLLEVVSGMNAPTPGLIAQGVIVQDDTIATLEKDEPQVERMLSTEAINEAQVFNGCLPVVLEEQLEDSDCQKDIGARQEKGDDILKAETTQTTMAETSQSTIEVAHQGEVHVIRDDHDHKDDGDVHVCCAYHGNAKSGIGRVCM